MAHVMSDPLTHNSSIPEMTPGDRVQYKNGVWVMYVRAEDADISQGDCVYPASSDGAEVTNDVSGGSRLGAVPAGMGHP